MTIIHDHFGGTAHCIECEGPCVLSGDDRAASALVRYTLEFAEKVHKGWMWDFTRDALLELLGPARLSKFQRRAEETIL